MKEGVTVIVLVATISCRLQIMREKKLFNYLFFLIFRWGSMIIAYYRGVLFNLMKGMWIPILIYNLALIHPRDLSCQVDVIFSDVIYLASLFWKILTLVISGGEDCKLRLWSIKSGELLLEDKFSDSVLSTMCYQTFRSSKHHMLLAFMLFNYWLLILKSNIIWCVDFKAEEENPYKHDSSLGAWLGSHEGLFYMHWLWVWRVLQQL